MLVLAHSRGFSGGCTAGAGRGGATFVENVLRNNLRSSRRWLLARGALSVGAHERGQEKPREDTALRSQYKRRRNRKGKGNMLWYQSFNYSTGIRGHFRPKQHNLVLRPCFYPSPSVPKINHLASQAPSTLTREKSTPPRACLEC